MKYSAFIFVLFFSIFSFQSTSFAESKKTSGDPSVYDSIHKGEVKKTASSPKVVDSQSPSIFPFFLKFVFSFLLVIGLLMVLLRYLSKRNRLIQANGLVLPLGGHVLGNNRSLQLVLIGQTIYVIGVGETISLIRTISQGEEYQHLLESYENQADGTPPKWLTLDSTKKWTSVFQKHLRNMQKENGEE